MQRKIELTDLVNRIEQWSKNLGLDINSNPINQHIKLNEEFGELAKAIQKKQLVPTMDGLGDTIVVAVVAGSQLRPYSVSEKYNDMPLVGIGNEYDPFTPKPPENAVNYNFYVLNQHLCRYINYCVDSHKQTQSGHYLFIFFGKVLTQADMLAKALDIDLIECLKMAYTTIHFRSGEIIDGIFVKREPQAILTIPVKFLQKDIDTVINNVVEFSQQNEIKYFKVEFDIEIDEITIKE